MQFIYAIEGVASINAARLAECGLNKIIRDPSRVMQAPSATPGGAGEGTGSGCIFASGRDDERLRYEPDKQTWSKSINEKGGGYWVGFYTDNPPTAADLARDEQIDGHKVKLSDGSEWLVPMARCFPVGTKLPETLILTKEGLGSRPIAKYAQFSRRAQRMWNSVLHQIGVFEGELDEVIDARDEWILAAEALGLNYYVSAAEINALELLTTTNLAEIVMAVVDMPTYRKWLAEQVDEKKNSLVTSEG